jgi:hypothetical protein
MQAETGKAITFHIPPFTFQLGETFHLKNVTHTHMSQVSTCIIKLPFLKMTHVFDGCEMQAAAQCLAQAQS